MYATLLLHLHKLIQLGMQVKLLKDHDGNLQGDVINVTPERANYLIRCQIAEEYVKKATKPKADKK